MCLDHHGMRIVRTHSVIIADKNETVVEIITSTVIDRTQILHNPVAFCFMLYIMPETEIKCLVL